MGGGVARDIILAEHSTHLAGQDKMPFVECNTCNTLYHSSINQTIQKIFKHYEMRWNQALHDDTAEAWKAWMAL